MTDTKFRIAGFVVLLAASVFFARGGLGNDAAVIESRSTSLSGDSSSFNLLRETRAITHVYRVIGQRSSVYAKMFPGAVMRFRKVDSNKRCRAGWMEREGGGYVCAANLKPTSVVQPRKSERDSPEIVDGYKMVLVERSGARLYRSRKEIDARDPYKRLKRDSTLFVKRRFHMYGTDYYETRHGWAVEIRHLKDLPPPIEKLGVSIKEHPHFRGMVIDNNTPVYLDMSGEHMPVAHLERWRTIEGTIEGLSNANGNWIKLPGDAGYIPDQNVALLRSAPVPEGLAPGEKWLAVDLEEQMVHAYEGNVLVWASPCSTGIKDNTNPGEYRIKLKRRLQTLRALEGRFRAEDVQWVMYYDKPNSIAIHTAYWHDRFGRKRSHGCVNLPVEDARWVFYWTAPVLHPQDSERYAKHKELGTRVVVF